MPETPNDHGKWLTWGTEEYTAHMADRLAGLLGWTPEKARSKAEDRMADRTGQQVEVLGPQCTHCGSIHPDSFFEAIEKGYPMEVADWKYGWPHKIYIDWPNPKADEPRLVGSTSKGSEPRYDSDTGQVTHRVKTQDDPPDAHHTVWDDRNGWSYEGTYATIHAKFYTEHLGAWERLNDIDVRIAIWERTGIDFLPPTEAGGGVSLPQGTPDDRTRRMSQSLPDQRGWRWAH